MNPLDPYEQRLRELEAQMGALEDPEGVLQGPPDVFEAMQLAALKRGPRRPHGGLGGFR